MLQTHSFHWLVTGGAGFIGSHLVRALVSRGQRVSVLDNLSGGFVENLAAVQDKINFIRADVRSFPEVAAACRGVDYVLHHAALTSVAQSMQIPQQTIDVNVQGTLNILEASRQHKVKRVLFASSSAVYGNRPELPYTEQTPPDCQSPYAWSKQAAAELCLLYTKIYGLDTVVLRYFNVFGIGQNPHAPYAGVIAKFMQLAHEHRPLVLDWDGLQRRDFISVHDIVQANLLAIEKASAGQTYNVASGTSYTLLELVDMIEKIAGYPLQRLTGPKRPGDLHQSCADISKLRNLGFVPKVTLQQGLTEMWQHQLHQKTK